MFDKINVCAIEYNSKQIENQFLTAVLKDFIIRVLIVRVRACASYQGPHSRSQGLANHSEGFR